MITISPRRWWGLHEFPAQRHGWGASPIFVTAVTPLKSGQSLLRIEFVQLLHPVQPVRRTAVVRVQQRSASELVAIVQGGSDRILVVSEVNLNWVSSFCERLWEKRQPNMWYGGGPNTLEEVQEYLCKRFGMAEDEIVNGASETTFPVKSHRMPSKRESFGFGVEFSPFDSWLISRGFVPQEMEDKWFIYKKGDHLFFRRSWTGFLIYMAEIQWRSDRLYVDAVTVNRNPKQYAETDIDYERELFGFIIDAFLLRKPVSCPVKP